VLERGEPLERHFTVRTVTIPEPSGFAPKRIAKLIDSLGISQAVFARLIGVSLKLVEAWLAGTREPSRMARRLLELIEDDPRGFLRRVKKPAA